MAYTIDENYNVRHEVSASEHEPSLLEAKVSEAGADNVDRRDFLKKLTYIPPLVITFNLAETTYGTENEDDNESQGRGRGRRRRRISPAPRHGRGHSDDKGDDYEGGDDNHDGDHDDGYDKNQLE